AVSRLPAATAPGKLLGNHTCPSTIQGLRCPSGRSCGLKQLHQITFRILERRDPYRAVVRGILDELDPGVPQAFPVAREVVARETDHVPSRVGIGTVHLAMRAQPEPAEYHE